MLRESITAFFMRSTYESWLVQASGEVLQYTVDRGETLLHLAVKHNRKQSLKLLIYGELHEDHCFTNIKDDEKLC